VTPSPPPCHTPCHTPSNYLLTQTPAAPYVSTWGVDDQIATTAAEAEEIWQARKDVEKEPLGEASSDLSRSRRALNYVKAAHCSALRSFGRSWSMLVDEKTVSLTGALALTLTGVALGYLVSSRRSNKTIAAAPSASATLPAMPAMPAMPSLPEVFSGSKMDKDVGAKAAQLLEFIKVPFAKLVSMAKKSPE
jgi:hypothetical protein